MSNFETSDAIAAEVRAVTGYLAQNKINFIRHTTYHLKIGKVNYYFGRGKIVIDGHKTSYSQNGLSGLKTLLRELGLL